MRTALIRLGAVVLLFAAALSAYRSWYRTAAGVSADAALLGQRIEAVAGNTPRTSSARAALAEVASDEALVGAHFLSESSVVSFVTALESAGASRGAAVAVSSVSAAGSSEHPAFSIALTATGSFDAVMRTAGAIEFAPYAVSVSTLSLREGRGGAWTAALVITVGASAAPQQSVSFDYRP